jgi:hypothetical protein
MIRLAFLAFALGIPQDRTDLAVSRAVGFLVSKQNADGSIHATAANATAMTSLAVMSMAAVGHQPTDETREGRSMRKALDFLLRPDRQDPEGYFGGADGSRMYGHGIATLALAELLGMGIDARQDKLLLERCRKSVQLILRSQKVWKQPRDAGGWRYNPDSDDSDLSATIWQVMALRSAKNAGVEVPREAIDLAVDYIKRCYHSPRGADGRPTDPKSAFAYGNGRAPVYSTAAAGILALQMCGAYDAPEVNWSAEWLAAKPLDPAVEWFYYGTYYYAQGMYQRGGEASDLARKKVEQTLLGRQNADGSWPAQGREQGVGPVYSTSLSVLALAVKYHYLPIYQR